MPCNKRTLVVILCGIGLIGLGVYFWFDPEQYALFPKCVFHELTGWECPGCGSQRAIHSLLHGRPGQALAYNPLMVLSLPYIGVASYLEYFEGKKRFPGLRKTLMGRTACLVIFAVILLYWLGRNLV